MSSLRQVRGDLRKLLNPSIALLLVLFVAVLWRDASRTTGFAKDQTPVAVAVTQDNQNALERSCTPGPEEDPAECSLLKLDVQANGDFSDNGKRLGEVATAYNTFPGLLTLVAHHMATGLGWSFIGLLAALHITNERFRGTSSQSVLRTGRFRYLAGKSVSLVCSTVAGVICAALVLFLIRSTFVSSIQVQSASPANGTAQEAPLVTLPPSSVWSSWSEASMALLRSVPVFVFAACLFTAISTLFRRPVFAAVANVGLVVGLFAVSSWTSYGRWTPHAALSKYLRLDEVPFGVVDTRLWSGLGRPSDIYSNSDRLFYSATSVLGPTLIAAAVVATGVTVFCRRNLLD